MARSFATLVGPRVERTQRRHLLDIVLIAIRAGVCGADGWVEVEAFGQSKQKGLKTFLALPHGIPSHDTLGRGFAALEAAEFQRCFLAGGAGGERADGRAGGGH